MMNYSFHNKHLQMFYHGKITINMLTHLVKIQGLIPQKRESRNNICCIWRMSRRLCVNVQKYVRRCHVSLNFHYITFNFLFLRIFAAKWLQKKFIFTDFCCYKIFDPSMKFRQNLNIEFLREQHNLMKMTKLVRL